MNCESMIGWIYLAMTVVSFLVLIFNAKYQFWNTTEIPNDDLFGCFLISIGWPITLFVLLFLGLGKMWEYWLGYGDTSGIRKQRKERGMLKWVGRVIWLIISIEILYYIPKIVNHYFG